MLQKEIDARGLNEDILFEMNEWRSIIHMVHSVWFFFDSHSLPQLFGIKGFVIVVALSQGFIISREFIVLEGFLFLSTILHIQYNPPLLAYIDRERWTWVLPKRFGPKFFLIKINHWLFTWKIHSVKVIYTKVT